MDEIGTQRSTAKEPKVTREDHENTEKAVEGGRPFTQKQKVCGAERGASLWGNFIPTLNCYHCSPPPSSCPTDICQRGPVFPGRCGMHGLGPTD